MNEILNCKKLNIFLNVTTKLALMSCVLCWEQHLKIKYVNRSLIWKVFCYKFKMETIVKPQHHYLQPSTTKNTHHGGQGSVRIAPLSTFEAFSFSINPCAWVLNVCYTGQEHVYGCALLLGVLPTSVYLGRRWYHHVINSSWPIPPSMFAYYKQSKPRR